MQVMIGLHIGRAAIPSGRGKSKYNKINAIQPQADLSAYKEQSTQVSVSKCTQTRRTIRIERRVHTDG
jgi:hypothetical protein